MGAFGAHAFSEVLQGKSLGWYQTAVQYQFIHGLTLLCFGLYYRKLGRRAAIAGWLFVAGLVIFSGTLYAMALGAPTWLGAVTPIGGVCLLAAWGLFVWCILRSSELE